MKARLIYIIVFTGLLGLLALLGFRLRQEKELLELEVHQKRTSLSLGLQKQWRDFLLEKARKGLLPETYSLKWNRKGDELREPFFPEYAVTLTWGKYRMYVSTGRGEEANQFLREAVALKNSWDRILALTELAKTEDIRQYNLTPYETTLIDPEGKENFRRLFDQFDGDTDFTFARHQFALDKVFYKVDQSGSIVAFLPSRQFVRETVLPEFMDIKRVPEAQIGSSIFDIEINALSNLRQSDSYWQYIWFVTSTLFVVFGLALFIIELRREKRKLKQKTTFMNQVMHELKTPLTGLKLHLQLLQSGRGSEDSHKSLDTSINRLNQLFDNVVLMGQSIHKDEIVEIKAEDINRILYELKSEFGEVDVCGELATNVYAEPKRLALVFRNLIKNAIKYGNRAKVEFAESQGSVKFLFEDEGPGVRTKDKSKIFEEFYRADDQRLPNVQGLGVGLYLCKKFAREMGAKLKLVNPGKPGAVFSLELKKGEA